MTSSDDEKKIVEGLGKVPKFALAGHGGRADVFHETRKTLANYVGRLYGMPMRKLVLMGTEPTLEEPVYPDAGDERTRRCGARSSMSTLRKRARWKGRKARCLHWC